MLTIQEFWLSMKSVLRAARQIINAHLEPLNLTSAAGDILFQLILENEGLTQEQLAQRLDVGKAAVSRTVDLLVAKGYVTRERDPDDARAYRLSLTNKANEIRALVSNAYHSVYELATQDISQDDIHRAAMLLDRVNTNLSKPSKPNVNSDRGANI